MHRLVTLAVVASLATLAAITGCGGGGGGGHAGTGGGFTGLAGFGGSGLVDGGPLVDGGGSSGADVRLDPAPPICGNGIVETGEACDVAAGCPTGQRCSATCACVAAPLPPADSGTLIADALAAGRIDYFTSLLYRAYWIAGDGRLPTEFDGDFTVAEDSALFLEVSRLWGTLTSAQQQQLLPYVARPNDPASVYSTPPTAASSDDGLGGGGDDLFAPGDPDPIQCPAFAQTGAPDWRFNPTTHFVVWSCGSGDPATDPYLGKRQAVAALAEEVWAKEVPGMGPPRDDADTEDPAGMKRIDIYLVPLNRCIRRDPNGGCAAVTSSTTIAGAVPDAPCDRSRGALTSSGYALMRLDLVPDDAGAAGAVQARSDFAHEFFHLLTYGLNLEAQGGDCRDRRFTGAVGSRTSWLTEASATWAEWAYTRGDNTDYRTEKFSDYQQRIPAADSLLDNNLGADDNPAYQAFVYPLFLSQEAGGRAPFEDFWKAARAPRTREALDDLLNTRWAFDRYFRDFAVKMLNLTLPGDPLAPLLEAVDVAVTPDFPPVNILPEVMLPALVTDFPFHVTLAPLAAQHQLFTVAPTTRWVDIDLTGAGPDLTLDAIVNVKGTWERRRPTGSRFTFCRDDARDDITELYLVIANTAHDARARADTDYKVKTRVACPGSLTGSIRSERLVTSHYQIDGSTYDKYERLSEIWTLGEESVFDPGGGITVPAIAARWAATFDHHSSTVTTLAGPCQQQFVLQTTDGAGAGTHVSQLAVSDAPGGVVVLSATSAMPGMFTVPMVSYGETCGGISSGGSSDMSVIEQLPAVSAYLQLTPEAGNPGRYRKSVVVAHQETPRTGGSDLVDWVVSWDVARNRR